jgi:hypothetical protein
MGEPTQAAPEQSGDIALGKGDGPCADGHGAQPNRSAGADFVGCARRENQNEFARAPRKRLGFEVQRGRAKRTLARAARRRYGLAFPASGSSSTVL